MSPSSAIDRLRPHAVPLVVFLLVALAVLVAPPMILGEVTARTYALTAAVVILAVVSVFPYAVLVALGTLPLLSAGIASFAAPETGTDEAHSFSTVTALRHVVAGFSYVLGAAVVGAVGIGAGIAAGSDTTVVPAILAHSFPVLGGVIVAGAFVSLQMWRYDTAPGALARRTVLGTVALGVLLAASPAVALWLFGMAS